MIIERVITVEYLEPSMSRELLQKFPDNSAFDFDYSQSGIWSPLLPHNNNNNTYSCNNLISDSLTEVRKKLFDVSNEVAKTELLPKKGTAISSALGFDQSQSGIWSPLLPRGQGSLISASPMEIRRKIFDGLEEKSQNKRKKTGLMNNGSGFGFENSQSRIWSPLLPRSYCKVGSSGFPMVIRRKIFDGLENKVPQNNKFSKMTKKIKKKMITAVSRKEGVDSSASPDKISNTKKGWGKALKAASRQFKKHKAPSLQIKLPNFLKIGDF